ncbi:MAG: hypothetical protein KDD67_17455 [Ignavibacteriae bacterium]|nr:hypothetical protein [Ignavibacteriota bacterium]MCB9217454.1 hypothetical protein [Ignavibacteria bacterium]
MQQQKVIFTVLPNGYSPDDSSKLRFSVFVSPRLVSNQANPTLALFDDFRDWPAALNQMSFAVQFGNGAPVAATQIGQPLESPLWKAMFTDNGKVDSFEFSDTTSKFVRSYPYANVEGWIKAQYQDIIFPNQTAFPTSIEVAKKLEPIMFYLAPDPDSPETKNYIPNSDGLKTAAPTQSMQKVQVRSELSKFSKWNKSTNEPHSRLQTDKIHPQLNAVLAKVPTALQATAMLDLQHLVQEATLQFKATTISALESIYSELNSAKAVNSLAAAEPTKDFLQVTFFHRPKQAHFTAVALPSFDFHEACASLSNYPEIMRRIGLVLDFEVPAAAAAGSNTIRFFPVTKNAPFVVGNLWNGSVSTDLVRPKTKFDLVPGKSLFRAQPKNGSDIQDGMFDLSGSKYKLSHLDIDGAAMKMMSLANTLRHFTPPDLKSERLAGIDPVAVSQLAPSEFASKRVVVETASLPALRTAGISLVKTNQAQYLVAKMAYAKDLNAIAAPGNDDNLILYMDDLVKGYRVDIRDSASGQWRSLCKRKGSYFFERTNETRDYDDEGWIEVGASSAADQELEELQKSWYVAETLTSWNGWSKVAPQPGKKIIQPEDESLDDTWNDNPNTSDTDYGLATNFKVQPGTLPRLRYGLGYRMRLRAADLAGNGLTLEEAGNSTTNATSELIYTRFEPIPTPFLVPKTGIKPGESVEHLVVRSNFNTSAADYATVFPIPDYAAYPADRHVVPARQVQRMAEEHGMFDDPNTGLPMPSQYTTIINNDAFFTPFNAALAAKAVRPEQNIGVPWLPDMARGTTFRGLPGMANGTIRKVDYGPFTNWPDLEPFILRLIEGDGVPEEITEGGVKVVVVKLPKAELSKALYSSYLDADDLQKMAIWDWLKEKGAPDQTKAANGLNWSLTPYRGLTLIHVTQQPLEEPVVQQLKAEKSLGDTFAMLSGKISVHGKSSSKVDTYAVWTEPIDNVSLPGPKYIEKKNVAFSDNVDFDDAAVQFPTPPEMKSNDQLLKKMVGKQSLSMIGGAKTLTSYKVQNTPSMAEQMTSLSTRKKTVQASTSKSIAKGGGARKYALNYDLAAKPDERRRHDFGDTKYRRVTYRSVSTSRFREYFLDVIPKVDPKYDDLDDQRSDEQDTSKALLTRTGETVELDILNSARPEAPKILYVIPSYGWEKQEEGDEIISKRVSGLRVWMERPWYSSGDGELLGVVVWPSPGGKKTSTSGKTSTGGGAGKYAAKTDIKSKPVGSGGIGLVGATDLVSETVIPDKLIPYVTQWGADPLWLAGKLRSHPKLGDFLNPAATDTGLSMEEFPSQKGDEFVAVAGYEVGYDSDRRLWFCDIEINPHEAYYPFIRLALARYHPKSVIDAHLSRIVMADYIQIAPDRSATVTFDPSDAQKVRVTVTGLAYRANAAGQFPSEVEVTIETATGPEGDLEWIPADDSDTVGLDRIGGLGKKLWDGLWAGEVELPVARGSQPMRLVIREYEVLIGDGGLKAKWEEGDDKDSVMVGETTELRRRLVYADAIEI